jgi:hypothetical protein
VSVATISPTVDTEPATGNRTLERLRIDFLFLDLTRCTRCRGTGRSLDKALQVVAGVLRGAGVTVEVHREQVVSAEQARALRFMSSPTIRVNGSDIALELGESSCGSEACTDGCGEGINCRVWVHRGREYTEPPTEMIVDAILRHVYGATTRTAPAAPYALPENLQRFFAGKDKTSGIAQIRTLAAARVVCCSSTTRQTCCDASTKPACCGGDENSCSCQ